MSREYKPSSRCVRAAKLRAQYDSWISRHVILSRHVIDAGRAVFLVGEPHRCEYRAEVAMLGHGTVFVNGDVDAVVFAYCSAKTWEGKLGWLRGTNYSYAEEKASIGSTCSAMARGYDEEVAKSDVLGWRREKYISKEAARDVLDFIGDGDYQSAQRRIWQEPDGFELGLGEVTNCRVILAQALITKLCELLDAEEALRAAALFRRKSYSWFGRAFFLGAA